jgi:hypothetical protein
VVPLVHHQFLSAEVIETFSDWMKGGSFQDLDALNIFNHFLKAKLNKSTASHHTIYL